MKIFVAGHRGMVGSAIVRILEERGARGEAIELVTRSRDELDLTDQRAVEGFLAEERPDRVVLAAAKVGGIHANNTLPAEFIYENLMMQNNVIHASYKAGAERLLFLGSSCIYPKHAEQPMAEEALLTGTLEPTNEPYAIAKIAGIKMCESYNRQYGTDFRSVMPTNLYGPGDNFHPEHSHVLPALMRRFAEAAERGDGEVTIWGSGTPRREFLYVDDMAAASLAVLDAAPELYAQMTQPMQSHINIGTGTDVTILELAQMIAETVGFGGAITLDKSKPDGTMRKLLDVGRLHALGYHPSVELKEGIARTWDWYQAHRTDLRSGQVAA